jgi:hypothetical protein
MIHDVQNRTEILDENTIRVLISESIQTTRGIQMAIETSPACCTSLRCGTLTLSLIAFQKFEVMIK